MKFLNNKEEIKEIIEKIGFIQSFNIETIYGRDRDKERLILLLTHTTGMSGIDEIRIEENLNVDLLSYQDFSEQYTVTSLSFESIRLIDKLLKDLEELGKEGWLWRGL